MNGEEILTSLMENNCNEKIKLLCSKLIDIHFNGIGVANEEIF
jgi:hypothetical protein